MKFFFNPYGAVCLAAALIFFAIFKIAQSDQIEKDRLMNQCIEDGHKEYECYSAIKKEGVQNSTIFIPMSH